MLGDDFIAIISVLGDDVITKSRSDRLGWDARYSLAAALGMCRPSPPSLVPGCLVDVFL